MFFLQFYKQIAACSSKVKMIQKCGAYYNRLDKHMIRVSKFGSVIKTGLASAMLCFASTAAEATYYYFDIKADVGSYDPIVLGEDLELDACGSDVHRATSTDTGTPTYGLCDFNNYSIFSIGWEITFNGVTDTLAYFSGSSVANGLTYTAATGAGSLISQAGSYMIGLWVQFESNSSFTTPDPYWVNSHYGGHYTSTGYTGNDSGYIASQSGERNQDYDSVAFTVTDPVTVPEPAAALLLLPAMALIARRQRKRKQAA